MAEVTPQTPTGVRLVYGTHEPINETDGNYVDDITSPYTITGLTNGTRYHVKLFTYNQKGRFTASQDKTVTPSFAKLDDVSGASITTTPGTQSAVIKWTDPMDKVQDGQTVAVWEGTKVMRKAGSAPTSIDDVDATEVIDSTTRNAYSSTGYTDSGLTYGTTYYYRFFPYTTQGAVTDGSSVNATPDRASVAVPTFTATMTYTGSQQTATFTGYDSTKMTVSGNTGTNAGSYTATFNVKEDYKWSDDTRTAKTVAWSIGKATGSLGIAPGTSYTLDSWYLHRTIGLPCDGVVGDYTHADVSYASSDTSIFTVRKIDDIPITPVVCWSACEVYSVNSTSGTATLNITAAATTNYTAATASITIQAIFELSLEDWLEAGGVTGTYADFADVEADEEAVRKLMTKHAAVDYLATCDDSADPLALNIINSDICAKWINLRDYALDTLYDNTYLASMMDTADKYFYGEWTIIDSTTTPVTWGPKGNVPVMTSNTAPYGEAFASSSNSNTQLPWNVFRGTSSLAGGPEWTSATAQSSSDPVWIGYKFTNPICVKRFRIVFQHAGYAGTGSSTYKIQGSNDNVTWTDASNSFTDTLAGSYIEHEINNNSFYMYYRVYIITQTGYAASKKGITTFLQFYGREMKVSVPTMTSNTDPYGEILSNGQYGDTHSGSAYQYPEYQAFDGDASTRWTSKEGPGDRYIGYDFGRPILLKTIAGKIVVGNSVSDTEQYKLQASNDGQTWTDILTLNLPGGNTPAVFFMPVSAGTLYSKYRVVRYVPNSSGNDYHWQAYELQFYGLDYSEYDWDTENPRHYIYDHGIEPNGQLIAYDKQKGCTNVKEPNQLYTLHSSNAGQYAGYYKKEDLNDYHLLRISLGDKEYKGVTLNVMDNITSSASTLLAYKYFGDGDKNLPYNLYLDISNINGQKDVAYANADSLAVATIDEWWLE